MTSAAAMIIGRVIVKDDGRERVCVCVWIGAKILKCVNSSDRGRRKHLYLNLGEVEIKTACSAPLALL